MPQALGFDRLPRQMASNIRRNRVNHHPEKSANNPVHPETKTAAAEMKPRTLNQNLVETVWNILNPKEKQIRLDSIRLVGAI
jgi:hypothetical protein